MTDVGEESGLRAIDLGQGLRTPALDLVSACAGKSGGNLAGQKVDEARIRIVEVPVGVAAAIMQPTGFSCPVLPIGSRLPG